MENEQLSFNEHTSPNFTGNVVYDESFLQRNVRIANNILRFREWYTKAELLSQFGLRVSSEDAIEKGWLYTGWRYGKDVKDVIKLTITKSDQNGITFTLNDKRL